MWCGVYWRAACHTHAEKSPLRLSASSVCRPTLSRRLSPCLSMSCFSRLASLIPSIEITYRMTRLPCSSRAPRVQLAHTSRTPHAHLARTSRAPRALLALLSHASRTHLACLAGDGAARAWGVHRWVITLKWGEACSETSACGFRGFGSSGSFRRLRKRD